MRRQEIPTTTAGVVAGFVQDGMPTRLVFGTGAMSRVCAEVAHLGTRGATALLTPSALRHSARLSCASVVHVVDGDLDPSEVALTLPPDHVLVAIGGRRAMATARVVAGRTGRPLVAVPTSYGSAETRRRTAGDTHASPLPATIVYDPSLTRSLPTSITAVSALAAIARAVRLLCVGTVSPLAELAALEAIRCLADGARDAVLNPTGLVGRSRALYGAHLLAVQLARTPGQAADPSPVDMALARGGGLHPADIEAGLLPGRLRQAAAHRPVMLAAIADALAHDDAVTGAMNLASDLGVATGLHQILPDPNVRARAIRIATEATLSADELVVLGDEATCRQPANRTTAGRA